jgi:mannose-6-phosphate isomerase-like protein (cupin superfamily)
MLSFLAIHPPRTKIRDQKIIPFDDGRSQIEFKPPNDRYLVINRWPPAASDADVASGKASSKGNCAIAPPPHWHRYQSEEFHVLKGRAYFWVDGVEKIAEKGEVVTVPRGAFHMFRNASEEEGMEIEFVLDPKWRERDEDYFRE